MKVELNHHSNQHCYSSHVSDVLCRLLIFANVRPSIKGIILRRWSHTIAYATSHAHTPPSTSPHSQLLNDLKPLCVHGGTEESHVACNGCGRRRTVYTVVGREWCEVRRSNRSTVHCTRVWYGVWVGWCAAILVAGE